jgi:hypothetical protein
MKPTWRDLSGAFERIGGVGCCWHIVTEDGNTNKSSIDWCVNQSQFTEHPACLAAAVQMRPTAISKAAKRGSKS